MTIANSGSWTTFIDNFTTVQTVTGIHNLYVIFKSTFQGVGDFDYYIFSNPSNRFLVKRFQGETVSSENEKPNFQYKGSFQSNAVSIYPNPSTNGQFNITFSENTGDAIVNVIDLHGVIVKKAIVHPMETLKFNNLNAGVYIVKVFSNEQIQTQKIVVK